MIQYKKKTIMKEIEETKLATIICNSCLKQEEMKIKDNNIEAALAESSIKKFSNLFDLESEYSGESWSFHLCEKCFIKTIKGLKLLPEGFQENPFVKTKASLQERQEAFIKWRSN